jgi:hypothetical protein
MHLTDINDMTIQSRVIAFVLLLVAQLIAGSEQTFASEKEDRRVSPLSSEVHIGPNGIVMPLQRILLVRKGTDYCAIKFIRFWSGKTEEDHYAEYESYSTSDKTGDFKFLSRYIETKKRTASFSRLYGYGRLAFSFGNKEVECGEVRLFWSGHGAVYFFARGQLEGDYGIELAPTSWTDVSQVNLSDPRILWYRYDTNRKRTNIPIDDVWSEPEHGK